MKKLIFLFLFNSLFFTTAFSQVIETFKIDTTFNKRSIYCHQQPFKLGDTIDFRSQGKDMPNSRHPYFQRFLDRNYDNRQDMNGDLKNALSYDNMPVFRPRVNYAMKIYKPDPSIRYSLLIKRYPLRIKRAGE